MPTASTILTPSTEIDLSNDSYIAFDALSLKQQIQNRLTKSGILTDQAFEGSNISEITDIVAFSFHVLMFYLNRTSNESLFSNAQLYENMNKIVKAFDYKPIGFQSSTLSFLASAADLTADLYTIPRYSYLAVNDIPFSFNEDITFAKTTNLAVEELTEFSKQKLLFQGKYIEYPIYNAVGNDNELIFLLAGTNELIDHFNIDVYVKTVELGTWQQYKPTPSLYLEDAFASKYEIRLNENQNYEIKFGNDINGRKLRQGDQVAIYYLRSLGTAGEVGATALFGKRMFAFNTVQFQQILNDVSANQYTYMNNTSLAGLAFNNDSVSTYVALPETVDQIRDNAPGTFRSQYRLVNAADYETFIRTNFANLIQDVSVLNNTSYITENLKYYYDIGLTKPNRESRVLYNQVNFSDACNFNNVYVVTVPKVVAGSTVYNSYLSPAQKELIISSMESEKTLTAEVIITDPVYVAVAVGLQGPGETAANVLPGEIPTITPSRADADSTVLQVVKDPSSRRDDASIRNDVQGIFTTYFSRTTTTLGQLIDINLLAASILAIPGVKTFYTARTDTTDKYEGLALLIWNPIYESADVQLAFKNVSLPSFKYPYFFDLTNFANNKVQVVSETAFTTIDF